MDQDHPPILSTDTTTEQIKVSTVLQNIQSGYWLFDLQGRLLEVNDAYCRMSGYTREELLQMHIWDLDAVESQPEVLGHIRQVQAQGSDQFERCHRRKDGSVFDVDIRTTYLDVEDGLMVTFVWDITDRKEKEKELARVNRTLKALSDVNQAMGRVTAEADFLAAVCQVIVEDCGHPMVWIGYAEDDEAKSVRPVAYAGFENGYLETLKVTWADTERGRGPTGTAIRTAKPAGCKNTLTDPNFKPWRAEALKRGYASSLVVPMLAGGKAMGAITLYSREPESFTDREVSLLEELARDLAYGILALRTRAAHDRVEEALRESEERYRSLVDLAPEGIGVHDGHTWLYMNPAGVRLFGAAKPADIVGKPVMSFIHADDREPVKGRIQQILEADQIAPGRELRIVRLDGREIYIEASGVRTTYLGKPAVQVIYQDVTERKRFQEALQKARDELEVRVEARTDELLQANQKLEAALSQEQAMREHLIQSDKFTAMGHLLASVAHELNNPLQTIKNCLYLIRQETPPDSPVQEYLEMSVSETRRLANLVAQLRELYRPQGEVTKLASLSRLLNEVGSLLAPHLANNDAAWVLTPPAEDYTINCIADQIKQVFINISMNAVEAMLPGGGTLSIRVVQPGEDGLVGITFQDTGPGIPPDVQARLFEPFFTTKPSGLGLGLSITYELIQRHHGRITLESQVNQGVAFTVWLPVIQQNSSQP